MHATRSPTTRFKGTHTIIKHLILAKATQNVRSQLAQWLYCVHASHRWATFEKLSGKTTAGILVWSLLTAEDTSDSVLIHQRQLLMWGRHWFPLGLAMTVQCNDAQMSCKWPWIQNKVSKARKNCEGPILCYPSYSRDKQRHIYSQYLLPCDSKNLQRLLQVHIHDRTPNLP